MNRAGKRHIRISGGIDLGGLALANLADIRLVHLNFRQGYRWIGNHHHGGTWNVGGSGNDGFTYLNIDLDDHTVDGRSNSRLG